MSKADNDNLVKFVKYPHGNVVATSKNNQIMGTYDYTAFGTLRESTEDISNPFRYCGEYYDEELDSVYLRNRYYQPSTGRFLTEDPIKDGLNWYSYCAGDPVNAWDPSEKKYIVDDMARWIWQQGAEHFLRNYKGWYLTATLLELSTYDSGQRFEAHDGDYTANLIKNDSGFRQAVNDDLWIKGTSQNTGYAFFTFYYAFDVSGGDLGAALHNVTVSVDATQNEDGSWNTHIQVYDTFDFTEFKNPILEKDLKSMFLWTMNDLAYLDQSMGVINPVDVYVEFEDVY